MPATWLLLDGSSVGSTANSEYIVNLFFQQKTAKNICWCFFIDGMTLFCWDGSMSCFVAYIFFQHTRGRLGTKHHSGNGPEYHALLPAVGLRRWMWVSTRWVAPREKGLMPHSCPWWIHVSGSRWNQHSPSAAVWGVMCLVCLPVSGVVNPCKVNRVQPWKMGNVQGVKPISIRRTTRFIVLRSANRMVHVLGVSKQSLYYNCLIINSCRLSSCWQFGVFSSV